jgi:hypothetical protein
MVILVFSVEEVFGYALRWLYGQILDLQFVVSHLRWFKYRVY